MKQISSVDLYFLVKEFNVLENSRIDNFYFENEIFYIRCYVKGKGHLYLTNKISKYIYIGDNKEESSHPNNFIQFLRKYLKSSFLRKIEQINNERILKITFEQKINDKIREYFMYLELFANGNIIICDENNIIKNSLQKKKFKDRDILVHKNYTLPPSRELSIDNVDLDILKSQINETDLILVKFLAIKFGMGGKFAEEVCVLLNTPKNIDPKEVDIKELKNILEKIKNKKISAHLLKIDEKIKDFYPFKFKSVKNLEKCDNFNDIIKNYYIQFKEEIDKKEENYEKEMKKLQNRLEKQQTQLKDVKINYELYNSYGNKIYENYSIVEELLKEVNKAGKEKGWDYVKSKIKSDDKLSKIIKILNYKNNEIVLDLD